MSKRLKQTSKKYIQSETQNETIPFENNPETFAQQVYSFIHYFNDSIIKPTWTTTYSWSRPAVKILFDVSLWLFKQWIIGVLIYSLANLVPNLLWEHGFLGTFATYKVYETMISGWSYATSDKYFVHGLFAVGVLANQLSLFDSISDNIGNALSYIVGVPLKYVDDNLQDSPWILVSGLAAAGSLWLLSFPVLSIVNSLDLGQGMSLMLDKFSALAITSLPVSVNEILERFKSAVSFSLSFLGINNVAPNVALLHNNLSDALSSLFEDGKGTGALMVGIASCLGGASIKEILEGNLEEAVLKKTTWFKYFANNSGDIDASRIGLAAILSNSIGETDSPSAFFYNFSNASLETKYRISNPFYYWKIISGKSLLERVWLTVKVLTLVAAEYIFGLLDRNLGIVFGLVIASVLVAIAWKTFGNSKTDLEIVRTLTEETIALEKVSGIIEFNWNEQVSRSEMPEAMYVSLQAGDKYQIELDFFDWCNSLLQKLGEVAKKTVENTTDADIVKNTLVMLFRRINDRKTAIQLYSRGITPESKIPMRIEAQIARAEIDNYSTEYRPVRNNFKSKRQSKRRRR